MDPALRRAFNAGFSDAFYTAYQDRLLREVGLPPFRLAETPLFLTPELRDLLARSAREILALLSRPEAIERMRAAIAPAFDAPGMDDLPSVAQLDFAIVRGQGGRLEGRIVELQGFPSLYAFTLVQARVFFEMLRALPGLDREYSLFFEELDLERAVALLRRTLVGDEDPETCVLLELDPPGQKTFVDFAATQKLCGIDYVCATELLREGRRLYRNKDGRRVPVRRIYNRIVFDELERKRMELPFRFTDELEVSWCPHPNWYWVWSKYSLPQLSHPAIPRARLLSEALAAGEPLEGKVLKPLFSFAGSGVKVEPTAADVAAIAPDERAHWLLQDRIEYARALEMPSGDGVAAEVRVMCLRPPGEPTPRPMWNLARLSRGKMMGVDQNKDLTWVGSSVGIWAV